MNITSFISPNVILAIQREQNGHYCSHLYPTHEICGNVNNILITKDDKKECICVINEKGKNRGSVTSTWKIVKELQNDRNIILTSSITANAADGMNSIHATFPIIQHYIDLGDETNDRNVEIYFSGDKTMDDYPDFTLEIWEGNTKEFSLKYKRDSSTHNKNYILKKNGRYKICLISDINQSTSNVPKVKNTQLGLKFPGNGL
jgi:hypothetical protein